jgi:hypothetical protein
MPKVGNNPRNGSWEREFEKNGYKSLPDCRVSYLERDNHRVFLRHLGQGWDTVFCASCHKPKMAVAPDCPHVFFICQTCIDTKPLPPEILVRQVPGT